MRKSDTGWVALALVEHLGGNKLTALSNLFDGDIEAIFNADEASLRRIQGIGPKIAARIQALNRQPLDQFKRQIEAWHKAGVSYATIADKSYPARLLHLPDPPAIVFWRGVADAIPADNAPAAAIIGTRQPTPNAVEAAERAAYDIAAKGWIVVSGLAAGIDAAAHRGALAAGGRTLAVLGSGILKVYPPENQSLANQLIRCGALISEVRPSAVANTPALVARNRLISAFSDSVLVVETAVDGGAMHAAKRAFASERAVFTFDLPATGNQALIEQGATKLAIDAAFSPI